MLPRHLTVALPHVFPLRRLMRAAVLASAFVLASYISAAGQVPVRQGFWWGFGAGAAYLDADCRGCDQLPDSIPYGAGGGFQVALAAGGTISPRLLLGGSTSLASRTVKGRDATMINVSAMGQFYPSAEGPLFLRGGAGLGSSVLAGGGTLIESAGVAALMDVGLDLWRSGRRAIGPYLGIMFAANSEASVSISQPEPLGIGAPRRPRAIYVGVGATWH